jgi:hypothetical protein
MYAKNLRAMLVLRDICRKFAKSQPAISRVSSDRTGGGKVY